MAKLDIRTVKVPVTTVTEETRYSLELNSKELLALYVVLERVGGDPGDTPRGQLDKIYEILRPAVSSLGGPLIPNVDFDFSGGASAIYFKSVEKKAR